MWITERMIVATCVLAPWLTACASKDALVCGTGTAECDDTCVATMEDPANCGACGNACGTDQRCVLGACVDDCDAGEALCEGACVDPLSSAANCGGCDQPCPTGDICDQGGCSPCGNGVWEASEQCDDGNNVSGDGCSDGCAYEGPPGSITFEVTGQIEFVQDVNQEFGGAFAVGDPVVGRYTIDPNLPDSNALVGVGDYHTTAAGYGFVLSIGGHLLETNPASVDFGVEVVNNYNGEDGYAWGSNQVTLDETGGGGMSVNWNLIDSSQTAYSSTVQPVTPPELSRFTQQPPSGLTITGALPGDGVRGVVLTAGY